MIKKFVKLFIISSFLSISAIAQEMDCASTIRYRYSSSPYEFDKQSKSAICYLGEKYEYKVFLLQSVDYRFSFYASSIFNNNIRFKIINLSTGEVLLDLPGDATENNTSAILLDYYDPNKKKYVHPYYDIMPEVDGNYKVIVEVGEQKKPTDVDNSIILVDSNRKKGCVTIFLQSKQGERFGF
jgi:hypothetical protein